MRMYFVFHLIFLELPLTSVETNLSSFLIIKNFYEKCGKVYLYLDKMRKNEVLKNWT